MKIHDKGTSKERIRCRCRIEGRFDGKEFVYEDPEGSDGTYLYWVEDKNPSEFWWSDGNGSCDCNRIKFVPENMRNGYEGECGKWRIAIERIIPLEGDNLPILELNEIDNPGFNI